jgi:Transposase DDE domain
MNANQISLEHVSKYLEELFGDDLHAKRVLSLSMATFGVIRAASLCIHLIGHALAQARGSADKHAIKQVDRLIGNDGIMLDDLFPAWIEFVIGHRQEAIVIVDWTEFAIDFQSTLWASVVTEHGRATPLMWRTEYSFNLKDRKNDIQYQFLISLRAFVPKQTKLIILADRGFGDLKLYRFLEEQDIGYVIRFAKGIKVWPQGKRKPRPIGMLVPEDGSANLLENAQLTHQRTVVPKVVFVQEKGMKDYWLLASNLAERTARKFISLYARRFTIEESFRDVKDYRFGMGLSAIRVRDADRRDRLLLLSALAIGLLTLLGAAGESLGMERMLKANTSKKRTYSLFRQGCLYYGHIPMMKEEKLQPLMERFFELLTAQPIFTKLFGPI